MYHVSNFGQFGTKLKGYADLDGFVREEGDDLTQFRFPSGWFDDPDATAAEIEEEWRDHIAAAEAVKTEAEAGVAQWREEHPTNQ